MAQKHVYLNAAFSDRWRASYERLQLEAKNAADRVVIALLKQKPTPGMRIKPIVPDKYYYEARINDAHRLIFRTQDGVVHFVDIVTHDDIAKYSRR